MSSADASKWVQAARIAESVRRLAFARDLESASAITCAAARQLTRADGVTFAIRVGAECHYVVEEASEPLRTGRRFPLHACASGWVMENASSLVVRDVQADDRIAQTSDLPAFVKSLAIVPVDSSSPVAAIGAYWAREQTPTDLELSSLLSLADGAALALANVRVFEDLKHAVEREQEARELAEAAAKDRDEFIAQMAHELRQPLHASLAALRLMAARPGRDRGQHARGVVERQINQMNRLVEDLVDAARVARGHVELRRELTDLRVVVSDVVDIVRPLMAERRHDLVVDMPETALMSSIDVSRVHQVLMNLLTNSAKYTDAHGRISLTVRAVHDGVTIVVRDNGRGIEPRDLPRVFDLFTRASDGSGFGVGLAVARRLVELHDGSIRALSAGRGRGTEIVIQLPKASGISSGDPIT